VSVCRAIEAAAAIAIATMSYAAEPNVIAQVGERQILYADVQCVPVDASAPDVDRVCRENEREMFRFELSREISRRACALEGWSPTEESVAPYRAPYLRDVAKTHELAEKAYVLPRAVLRVYLGEDAASVYRDIVAAFPRMSLDAFRGTVKAYRSREVVEGYLAVDPVVRFREAGERLAREKAQQEYLRKQVAARASATGRTFDAAADDYMQFLAKTLPIRVFDERFHLPQGREFFR